MQLHNNDTEKKIYSRPVLITV